jgi:RIO-like serine/threonine protein kinase
MNSSIITFEQSFYEEKKYRILKVLEDRMMTARQIQDAYIEEFGKITQSETQEEIEEMVESGLLEEEYSYGHFRKLFYWKN